VNTLLQPKRTPILAKKDPIPQTHRSNIAGSTSSVSLAKARTSANTNTNTNISTNNINNKAAQKAASLNKEIASLLGRKSLNASEAESDWFDGYSTRMDNLAKREYAQQKASEHTQSISVQVILPCNALISSLF
jgi:hypothetical protein